MNNTIYYGQTIFFSSKKGYGFLAWEKDGIKQTDLFVHFSDIVMEGYKTLKPNQKVSFEVGFNKNGDPKAVAVQILSD